MNRVHGVGGLLLGVWLVIVGLTPFVPALGGLGVLASVLALLAGLLILAGR